MWKHCVVFIILGFFKLTSTTDVYVEYENSPVTLTPEYGEGTTEVTEWSVTTCNRCKLGMSCYFNTRSCRRASITIDNGAEILDICPTDGMAFHNSSAHNVLKVSIKQTVAGIGAYCEVLATRPYLNMPEEDVNSAEHGLVLSGFQKPTCKCGFSVKDKARIVGGNVVTKFKYPFFVQLNEKGQGNICGGVIVTFRHVLTAAHCTHNVPPETMTIYAGMHDLGKRANRTHLVEIPVMKILNHPDYDETTLVNDISILFLKRRIPFNEIIGPICMPRLQQDFVGEYLTVMGFGRLSAGGSSPTMARRVHLRTIQRDICSVLHDINPNDNSTICTYSTKKDTCMGDSGGPLVRVNPRTNLYQLAALVSYGKSCAGNDPGVNTDVGYHMEWIRKSLKSTLPSYVLCY